MVPTRGLWSWRLVIGYLLPAIGGLPMPAYAQSGAVLVLAEDGHSDYAIAVADAAAPAVQHAAEELQHFLDRISGVQLPIARGDTAGQRREIIVGPGVVRSDLRSDAEGLGPEEYRIYTADQRLLIVGGEPRGTLYGVYAFLDEQLGCRWFTPTVDRIPRMQKIVIEPLDIRHSPPLEYREPFTYDCFDADWNARNRMNGHRAPLREHHGGKVQFAPGWFVHTFNQLVPPEEYFEAHPEYFSLVDGQRLKDRSQLCTTNRDVIRLATEAVLRAMREHPEADVLSVSQNDWYNFCQCDTCQALAQREGSQMAPVLRMVNSIAEAVEREFPGKAIETLAYQWTRKPPERLRPRDNVIVRLCSIECCFSHSLAECDSEENRAFREDAAAWAATGSRLWVWNYVTSFRHYLLPFPNQRIRNDNIRFFVQHGVTGIFEQDAYNTPHSELVELGGYLTARFLWNPECDEQQVIDEFKEGYYGAAAEPIGDYLDLLHDRVKRENIHVNIWAGPESPHLTDGLLAAADALWQEAERRVDDQPELLDRVRRSRMSVDYAIVERARGQSTGQTPERDQGLIRQLARQRYAPLIQTLRAGGVTRLNEWQALDLDDYAAELADVLELPAASQGSPPDAETPQR